MNEKDSQVTAADIVETFQGTNNKSLRYTTGSMQSRSKRSDKVSLDGEWKAWHKDSLESLKAWLGP